VSREIKRGVITMNNLEIKRDLITDNLEIKHDAMTNNLEIKRDAVTDNLEIKCDVLMTDNLEIKRDVMADNLEIKRDVKTDNLDINSDVVRDNLSEECLYAASDGNDRLRRFKHIVDTCRSAQISNGDVKFPADDLNMCKLTLSTNRESNITSDAKVTPPGAEVESRRSATAVLMHRNYTGVGLLTPSASLSHFGTLDTDNNTSSRNPQEFGGRKSRDASRCSGNQLDFANFNHRLEICPEKSSSYKGCSWSPLDDRFQTPGGYKLDDIYSIDDIPQTPPQLSPPASNHLHHYQHCSCSLASFDHPPDAVGYCGCYEKALEDTLEQINDNNNNTSVGSLSSVDSAEVLFENTRISKNQRRDHFSAPAAGSSGLGYECLDEYSSVDWSSSSESFTDSLSSPRSTSTDCRHVEGEMNNFSRMIFVNNNKTYRWRSAIEP